MWQYFKITIVTYFLGDGGNWVHLILEFGSLSLAKSKNTKKLSKGWYFMKWGMIIVEIAFYPDKLTFAVTKEFLWHLVGIAYYG